MLSLLEVRELDDTAQARCRSRTVSRLARGRRRGATSDVYTCFVMCAATVTASSLKLRGADVPVRYSHTDRGGGRYRTYGTTSKYVLVEA